MNLLPSMLTDTTLESPNGVIIIETKFYLNALLSNRGGSEKIRSQHLYQLMSYISNKAKSCQKPVEGILLYPTVASAIMADYVIQGHRVRICTIDLSKPWQEISRSLIAILDPEPFDELHAG
jgi:5-methylcytosine-specific restriction enzyme subunit McrC